MDNEILVTSRLAGILCEPEQCAFCDENSDLNGTAISGQVGEHRKVNLRRGLN